MALIKITLDRQTGEKLSEEIIDPEYKPNYSELAKYLAQKILNERRIKENESKRNMSIKK